MILIQCLVRCDERECPCQEFAWMPFEGVVRTYADGAYLSVPQVDEPQLPAGWTSKTFRWQDTGQLETRHFCPRHKKDGS
jgi:hypothetical protein